MDSIFDSIELNRTLFFPRPDEGEAPQGAQEIFVPVSGGERIHVRRHVADGADVSLLFFHGNGEIAGDYDDLAGAYREFGVELLAAEFRGYGKSTGTPLLRTVLDDSREVLAHLRKTEAILPTLCVMGRSLGSGPALELAAIDEAVAGCIVESGYANPAGILSRRGIDAGPLSEEDDRAFNNERKARSVTCPFLVLHGDMDFLIPPMEGSALFEASPAEDKRLAILPGVGHNDILAGAFTEYFREVAAFFDRVRGG